MSKVMLINVSHEEESRVAIVEGGVLESLEIESIARTLKGNIYKGSVSNVNAALEAAFVSYGDERAGFLPLDEVNFKVLPTLPGRDSHRGRGRIGDHLQPGREVLVQVVRDAFNSKPPTLSTFYSLPGRYLVLTPKSDGQGISRKIEDVSQRDRLKRIVEELDPPEGFGVIVRTAGMDQSKTELQRDLKYLLRLWESIEAAGGSHRAPALIYQERDVVLRTIRDHFTPDIEEVLIDDQEVFDQARRFVQAVMPAKEKAFKLYTGDKPLFSKYNLEDQIESIFRREVTLKSGGAIVIDAAEALTAIDVNSARSAREGSIEEMAVRTNVEAASEVARQLRLRDLGGLVVVDFIDMHHDKNTRLVEKTMRDALKKDKAKYDLTRISKFGLMEISRQRIKVAKASAAYTACGRCEGTGVVKTTEAAALAIFRRIQARVVKGDLGTLRATVPEEVAGYLLNQKRAEIAALERRYDTRIVVLPHPTMNPNRAEIETTARETPRAAAPERSWQRPLIADEVAFAPEPEAEEATDDESAGERQGEEPEAAPAETAEPVAVVTAETRDGEETEEAQPDRDADEEATGPGRKRRRRRRRSRRGEASEAAGAAAETEVAGAAVEAEAAAPEPGSSDRDEVKADPAQETPGAIPTAARWTGEETRTPSEWGERGERRLETAEVTEPGEDALLDRPADIEFDDIERFLEARLRNEPSAPAPPVVEPVSETAPRAVDPEPQPWAGERVWRDGPIGHAASPSVDAELEDVPAGAAEAAGEDDELEDEDDRVEVQPGPREEAQPGTPHRKRRRRRRRSRRGSGAGPHRAEAAPASPGEAASPGYPSSVHPDLVHPSPAAGHPASVASAPGRDDSGIEEDIPGGWWQKMRGGSKGRGRDQD